MAMAKMVQTQISPKNTKWATKAKDFLNTNVNYRFILRLKYLERLHHNMILLVLSRQFNFFGKYLSVHLRLSQLYS